MEPAVGALAAVESTSGGLAEVDVVPRLAGRCRERPRRLMEGERNGSHNVPVSPTPTPRTSPRRGPAARRIRRVGNVVNLTTPLGVLVAVIGRARLRPGPDGLLLAEGYRWGFPVAGAFTIGDVVISRHGFATEDPKPPSPSRASTSQLRLPEAILAHEARHAWQWLACGPGFLPLYLTAMGWSWLRTGDLASANPFERWAGLTDGGYPERPVRPIRVGVADLTARVRPNRRRTRAGGAASGSAP